MVSMLHFLNKNRFNSIRYRVNLVYLYYVVVSTYPQLLRSPEVSDGLQLSQFNPYSDFIMIRSTTRKHDGKVQYTSLCLSANYIIEEIHMSEIEKIKEKANILEARKRAFGHNIPSWDK